jgi:hypothetical protein
MTLKDLVGLGLLVVALAGLIALFAIIGVGGHVDCGDCDCSDVACMSMPYDDDEGEWPAEPWRIRR